MSNFIPDGWVKGSIGDFAKLQGGYAFKSSDNAESGTRWLKIANVGKGKIKWGDQNYLPSDFEKEYSNFVLTQGDSVVALTRPITQGELKVAQIRSSDTPSLLNQRVARILPKNHLVDRNFMYALFRYEDIARDIEITIFGTDPPNISTKQIEDIKVILPPHSEQQKIAAILTSVDNVIEKTQAQIDKLKDLKTGMMQELLTRGVGVDGKPHTEFKDSPVGRIPKAWDVLPFSKGTQKIQDGTHFSPQSKEGPCLYLTSKNIQKGKLLLKNISYISQEEHDAIYKRCNVQYGDVLLTKDGANTGNCAMNTLNEPFSLLSSVAFLRCNENICLNHYLYQFMSSNTFKRVVKDSMTGNAITRLTLTIIKNLKIAVPPINEQLKIVKYLSSIDNNLELKNLKLESLKSTKKALMQDLLTGKVRVKIDS